MARWRQDSKTHKLIPIDETAIRSNRRNLSATIHGDLESFVSPVDQTVITDRHQLREHNKRNDVIHADEFSPEFYAEKAKERARVLNGEHTRKETFERKQELYNNGVEAERKHGY